MIFKEFKGRLLHLIREGHKWQLTGLDGKVRKPPLYFSSLQWLLLAVSLGAALFVLNKGLGETFVGFGISALSLLFGLFLQLLVSVFDKFMNLEKAGSHKSEVLEIEGVKEWNFLRQFMAIVSYSMLLCLLLISLMALPLLHKFFLEDSNLYSPFNLPWSLFHQPLEPWNCIKFLILLLVRTATIYFSLDLFLLVIYALSSFYKFVDYSAFKKKSANN